MDVDPDRMDEIRARLNDAGFARLIGLEVRSLERGRARVAMRVDERLDNWIGRTHGAAVMALADQAVGAIAAAMANPPRTIQLSVNLINAPSIGQEIVATAQVVHASRRLSVFDFDVRDAAGRLLAHGQATGFARATAE